MELTFQELVYAIEGEIIVDNDNKVFNELSIDTRNINKDNIYLAIKGANFDGNAYAKEALSKGASIAIVENIIGEISEFEGLGIVIKVKNTKEALLSLANYYRKKLGIKVVGITGSTGKTSTKDLVAAFLSGKYNVFKTKGNFNNDIGMPLMILKLNSSYDVAILEMGMSNLGEIEVLAKTAIPDIALITNIGLSHIENLKTQENILKAKMEITTLFNENNTLILNGEDDYLSKVESNDFNIVKVGLNDKQRFWADNIEITNSKTKFTVKDNCNGEYNFTLPMVGAHNVLNALLGIGACRELGLSYEEMDKGLVNLEATSMRLDIKTNENITIIDDCYNASPDSMKAALDVLSNREGRKVAILGTMKELGDESKRAHREVGEYSKDTTDILIVCGEFIEEFKLGYNKKNVYCFNTKEELMKELPTIIRKGDNILVKASRGEKFEEIVKKLDNLLM